MSIELIHLRKLLKLMYLTPNRQITELRADIRQDIARESGVEAGGGDFHAPFWRDARDHALHLSDLHNSVAARIESNAGRSRLYPRLRDGFLNWWNERRRWTNEPFRQISSPHARITFDGLGTIKVEGILAVRDAANVDHFVYPYFAEVPPLRDESARLGLWVLHQAFPNLPADELRILDVIRGRTFSTNDIELLGDEQQIFLNRFQQLRSDWIELRHQYGL